MVKEIHCFGTSFTAGGGFEFFNKEKKEKLLENYNEEPFTQFYYSYPGQLQKLVGDGVKVFNHGKSGYGNERMYRKAFEIIDTATKLDDKVFIFEFSALKRKEFWSNTYNNHIIVNYEFNDTGGVYIKGIAEEWWLNDKIVNNTLKNIIEPFMLETIKFEIQEKLINQNTEFFIDYLLHNKINFFVVQEPWYEKSKRKILPYTIDFGNGMYNILNFSFENKLTITAETNGNIQDLHTGFTGNKLIAKKIANKLNLKRLNVI
jgi:hypothetical protein